MKTERGIATTNKILDNIKDDDLLTLLYNVVEYAINGNYNKTNWIARRIFTDIISEELIRQLFDEE